MYDSDIARILPEWSSSNKAKRDKIFGEYQSFSFQRKNERAFEEMEGEADILDRERFLKLLPVKLNARDSIGLLSLMDENWAPVEDDEEKLKKLSLDVWDSANASIINALDARDFMLPLHLSQIIKGLCMHNGRALRKLRRSTKFISWLSFAIDDSQENMLSAPPVQYEVLVAMKFAIIGCSKAFFDQLVEHDILKHLFFKIRNCSPCLIGPLGDVLECCITVALEHGSNNRKVQVMCQVGNQMICNRAMDFDFTKQRFRSQMKAESWTDVGVIAGAFANMLITMSLFMRVPTPMNVRRHLGTFGESYTNVEPTNPIERERWSHRYFCKRLNSDFSTDAGQLDGAEMKMTNEVKERMVEENRISSIQCGQCRDIEPENDALFSKCSQCKMVYYCSRECQSTHWPTHKKMCTKPAKASLPEPLLNLNDSIMQAHAKLEGNTIYPTVFAVWLHKYYVKNK
jgi:hypothetical protein